MPDLAPETPGDGLTACQRHYRKHRERRKAEALARYHAKRAEMTPEELEAYTVERKERYYRNIESERASARKYAANHREEACIRAQKWREENRERALAAVRKWAKANREWKTKYHREKLLTDPGYRLACALRSRLYCAIRDGLKTGSAVRDLGCSIDELIAFIESKFTEGMSWSSWGEWHLDHIKPLASFDLTDREQFLAACHYTNLQPLWAADNYKKGDKIHDGDGNLVSRKRKPRTKRAVVIPEPTTTTAEETS
jgi:hypothetical protein